MKLLAPGQAATGSQAHSVRGALSGSIKKGLGLAVNSAKTDSGRRYGIQDDANAERGGAA